MYMCGHVIPNNPLTPSPKFCFIIYLQAIYGIHCVVFIWAIVLTRTLEVDHEDCPSIRFDLRTLLRCSWRDWDERHWAASAVIERRKDPKDLSNGDTHVVGIDLIRESQWPTSSSSSGSWYRVWLLWGLVIPWIFSLPTCAHASGHTAYRNPVANNVYCREVSISHCYTWASAIILYIYLSLG